MEEGGCPRSSDLPRLQQTSGPAAVQAQATPLWRLQKGYRGRLGTWAEDRIFDAARSKPINIPDFTCAL